MDAAAELWEWGKTIILGTLSILLTVVWFFFRNWHADIKKRLDNHDEDIEKRAMVSEIDRHRIEVDQRFRLLEGDVKNLGEKFTTTMQTQLDGLRRDVFSAISEQNKRLDQLLLAITKRNSGQD